MCGVRTGLHRTRRIVARDPRAVCPVGAFWYPNTGTRLPLCASYLTHRQVHPLVPAHTYPQPHHHAPPHRHAPSSCTILRRPPRACTIRPRHPHAPCASPRPVPHAPSLPMRDPCHPFGEWMDETKVPCILQLLSETRPYRSYQVPISSIRAQNRVSTAQPPDAGACSCPVPQMGQRDNGVMTSRNKVRLACSCPIRFEAPLSIFLPWISPFPLLQSCDEPPFAEPDPP